MSRSGWERAVAALIVLGVGVFLLIEYLTSTPGPIRLSPSEQDVLLRLVREHLDAVLAGRAAPQLDPSRLPRQLRPHASCFVTLTINGALRGCMIDAFRPYEPLYQNAMRNAVLAATGDDRFPTLTAAELGDVRIEISVLGRPTALTFDDSDGLIAQLRPRVDGVILTTTRGTSSFLPHVWEELPDPARFLTELCRKQSAPDNCWRTDDLIRVETYPVSFCAENDVNTD